MILSQFCFQPGGDFLSHLEVFFSHLEVVLAGATSSFGVPYKLTSSLFSFLFLCFFFIQFFVCYAFINLGSDTDFPQTIKCVAMC